MTYAYRVWRLLSAKPMSRCELARANRMPYDKVTNAFKNLQDVGAIVRLARRGRETVYRVEGQMTPEGRGKSPGSAAARRLGPLSRPKVRRASSESERRNDTPRARGYGSGRTELETAWPMSTGVER